jgi:hypothetical protein
MKTEHEKILLIADELIIWWCALVERKERGLEGYGVLW